MTAKTVHISPQVMGGMELEAQVAGHAFDGELGVGGGMDDRERAVNNIVNDTPKILFDSPCSPSNAQSVPRTNAREALGCLDLI